MRCPECGFRLDPVNESQIVCPACGADPMLAGLDGLESIDSDDELLIAPRALRALFLRAYTRLVIDLCADAETGFGRSQALDSLEQGPFLVPGSKLVN
jgi:hypothetical protein